jgi:hypothetical protein
MHFSRYNAAMPTSDELDRQWQANIAGLNRLSAIDGRAAL